MEVTGSEGGFTCPGSNPSQISESVRAQLNVICKRLFGREVLPEDITYSFEEVSQQASIAILRITGLPGDRPARCWTGAACKTRRLARESAANAALSDLRVQFNALVSDPTTVAGLSCCTTEDDADCASTSASSVHEALSASLDVTDQPCSLSGATLCAPLGQGMPSASPSSSVTRVSKGTCFDAKSQLSIFCQRLCQKCMSRGDVLYEVSQDGELFVATVRLNCLKGETFSGDPQVCRRSAQQSAAEAALAAFEKQRIKLFQGTARKRKLDPPLDVRSDIKTEKPQLHDACTKLAGRPLRPGDILYDVTSTDAGFTASLQLPCLRGSFEDRVWVSEICRSKQAARQCAASMALLDMQYDRECASLLFQQEADEPQILKRARQ